MSYWSWSNRDANGRESPSIVRVAGAHVRAGDTVGELRENGGAGENRRTEVGLIQYFFIPFLCFYFSAKFLTKHRQ